MQWCISYNDDFLYLSLEGLSLLVIASKAMQSRGIVVLQSIDCRVVTNAPPHTLPSRTAGSSNDTYAVITSLFLSSLRVSGASVAIQNFAVSQNMDCFVPRHEVGIFAMTEYSIITESIFVSQFSYLILSKKTKQNKSSTQRIRGSEGLID